MGSDAQLEVVILPHLKEKPKDPLDTINPPPPRTPNWLPQPHITTLALSQHHQSITTPSQPTNITHRPYHSPKFLVHHNDPAPQQEHRQGGSIKEKNYHLQQCLPFLSEPTNKSLPENYQPYHETLHFRMDQTLLTVGSGYECFMDGNTYQILFGAAPNFQSNRGGEARDTKQVTNKK